MKGNETGGKVMKRIIFAVVCCIVLFASAEVFASAFCDGWEAGYIAGFCHNQYGGCLRPMVPFCPAPQLGRDTFQDGYNLGFIAGQNARQ
jgi:hypothetical protein